jgi:hypothetical protein
LGKFILIGLGALLPLFPDLFLLDRKLVLGGFQFGLQSRAILALGLLIVSLRFQSLFKFYESAPGLHALSSHFFLLGLVELQHLVFLHDFLLFPADSLFELHFNFDEILLIVSLRLIELLLNFF